MREKLQEIGVLISVEGCGLSIIEVPACALIEFEKSQSDLSE